MDRIPGWLFLIDLFRAIRASLTLDVATFQLVLSLPETIVISVAVVLLAGLSHLIGQAIVLTINGTPPTAKIRAIVLGALMVIAEFILWMLAIWLIAGLVFGSWRPVIDAFRVLGIAYAPMLLGFVVLFPYVGPGLFQALRLWTVLAVTVATTVAFNLPPMAAAICAVAGWLGHYAVVRVIGRFTHTDDASMQDTQTTVQRLRLLAAQEGRRGQIQ